MDFDEKKVVYNVLLDDNMIQLCHEIAKLHLDLKEFKI